MEHVPPSDIDPLHPTLSVPGSQCTSTTSRCETNKGAHAQRLLLQNCSRRPGLRIFENRVGHQGSPLGVPSPPDSAIDSIPAQDASNKPEFLPRLQAAMTRHRRLPSDPVSSSENVVRRRQHQPRQRCVPTIRRENANRSFNSILSKQACRKKLIILVISGVFLAALVAVYCALSVSKATLDRELHILLIFMVMILVVLFGHSLIRFCMVALRRPRSSVAENRIPSREGPVGYAQLEHPIPVIVPGDEESLIGEKPAAPPPAYGLWRSSVRINPDLLYWRRVSGAPLARNTINEDPGEHRPPSYVSDDGVDYVIHAQPRSLIPTGPIDACSRP